MSEETAITKVDPADLADYAHRNFEQIVGLNHAVSKAFVYMGLALKENRDKKYYAVLGYDHFEHFLGDPQVSLSRSVTFDCIRIVETFIGVCNMDPENLSKYQISKLSVIEPVVKENPEKLGDWLAMTEVLSRSDLRAEVHAAQGLEEPEHEAAQIEAPKLDKAKVDYITYVQNHPCIICGKIPTVSEPTHAHHFPVTKGAGKAEVKANVIPLCGKCHSEYHVDPVKWTRTYQHKWGAYFFGLIHELWPHKSTTVVPDIDPPDVPLPFNEVSVTLSPDQFETVSQESQPAVTDVTKTESQESQAAGPSLPTPTLSSPALPEENPTPSEPLRGSVSPKAKKKPSRVGRSAGKAPGILASEAEAPVSSPPPPPSQVEDKPVDPRAELVDHQIWPPADMPSFRRCPSCGLITHPDDFLDNGNCRSCGA